IVVGERRFRAAKEAKLDVVPAIVKDLTDERMMELALLENLQREDLSPIEEAQAYSTMISELGITQEKLSKRLGKSRSHIANMTRLLFVPNLVISYIKNGELYMWNARALLCLEDEKQMTYVVNKIREENLKVRQVERLIQEVNDNKPKATVSKPKKDI